MSDKPVDRAAGSISTAFVLGAGLGTRLRPLTDSRPKPLVPVVNKPLITFAFDHLLHAGVQKFVVNTHHRPEAYERLLGASQGRADYRGREVLFRHEPVLLETGGGIKNAADLLGDEPFLVYNGDVLADFPLDPLIRAHGGSGNIATLALRSSGAERRIQFDADSGLVTDMRGLIGGRPESAFLFTGVSIVSPEIHKHIRDGEIVSIIPVLVDLMRRGARVGGVVVDEGVWFDIGNIEAYLEVHQILSRDAHRFSYLSEDWRRPVAIDAEVNPSARLIGGTAVGEGARVGEGAILEDVVVWPGEIVESSARLRRAVLAGGRVCESVR
jgi:NDP-sugar pyrophosphorylase family protein